MVPANRVSEVAGLLKSFQAEDLLAMTDKDTLQLVILIEKKLTFEARFLCRYLLAAAQVQCELTKCLSTAMLLASCHRVQQRVQP